MTMTIRNLINAVEQGEIRIPSFQRGFVWEPERVANLMDSMYKDYPFGSLLFWHTSELLKAESNLGPFTLPEPRKKYPVQYVLDGQQRVTSIFGVFQTALGKVPSDEWVDIYFDFSKPDDAQELLFQALAESEVDRARHFPLSTLFDSGKYRAATAGLDEEAIKKIDKMQERFKEIIIPVQTVTTENRSAIATIFERINKQGVRLSTLQLLSAWTWSEEFQLSEKFTDLAEELEEFDLSNVDEGDNSLILRCTAAILSNDPDPGTLTGIPGAEVRESFDRVQNGIKGAVDFLRSQFKVKSINQLPFATMLVPLSVFFAASGNKEVLMKAEQRQKIVRWFWRTAFSKRYASGTLRYLRADIEEMANLREGRDSNIDAINTTITQEFFTDNQFKMGAVNTKTFILLLAQNDPHSFVSGTPVTLDRKEVLSNKAEFHHMMPDSYLKKIGTLPFKPNCLANFCFLSRAENRHLGGDAPSVYRKKMPTNSALILDKAFADDALFTDDYAQFIDARSKRLQAFAQGLIA